MILHKDFFHSLPVTDVGTDVRLDLPAYPGKNEVVLFRIRVQADTDYLSPQFVQPDAEPRSLETSVTGHKDTLTFIKIIKNINHLQMTIKGYPHGPHFV